MVIGGPIEALDPLNPGKTMQVDSIGIVTVQDGPSLAARRDHRAGGRHRPQRQVLPQQLSGPRGVPLRRRPPRAAVCAADRRHLLHQPLVRHASRSIPKTVVPIGYVGVVVSYYGRTGQDVSGDDVPPRRARRRRRTRRPGAAARAGQVCVQHLCRQHRPGADDQLRPALGHRPDRDAPLRREPAVDRPRHQGRLRADAAAVGGRAHRLPEGPERDPALRRRQEADHPDARPDARAPTSATSPTSGRCSSCCRSATPSSTRRARSCVGSSTSSTSSASTS